MILNDCELIAFLATTRPEKTQAFYCDVLGLRFEEDNPSVGSRIPMGTFSR